MTNLLSRKFKEKSREENGLKCYLSVRSFRCRCTSPILEFIAFENCTAPQVRKVTEWFRKDSVHTRNREASAAACSVHWTVQSWAVIKPPHNKGAGRNSGLYQSPPKVVVVLWALVLLSVIVTDRGNTGYFVLIQFSNGRILFHLVEKSM